MAETTYTYSIANDFPDGGVNIANFDEEIRSSSITIALERIDTGAEGVADRIDIVFKDSITAEHDSILDGHTVEHVLGIQADSTLDPGATPTSGDRYILTDISSGQLHANFGQISGVENNDVVEYSGTEFIVTFDSNTTGNSSALTKNEADSRFYLWDGVSWATSKAGGLISAHDNTVAQEVEEVKITNEIAVKKSSESTNVYIFSPDLTDKTTWWHDAIQVNDESLGTGDGGITIFQLAHGSGSVVGENILDLSHGKVTDEDNLITPETATPPSIQGGYKVTLKVNGVEVDEREAYLDTGGDWSMDYAKGEITFFTPPSTGDSITCSYWYVPADAAGCIFKITSDLGTYITIDYVEAQFTTDMKMNDSFIYTFTPVSYPSINLISPLEYKNMYNIVDFSVSSLPVLTKSTSLNSGDTIDTSRSLTEDMQVIPWRYTSELNVTGNLVDIPGLGSQKIQMFAYLKRGTVCGGHRATITIYGTQRAIET